VFHIFVIKNFNDTSFFFVSHRLHDLHVIAEDRQL
jgi:hypothetical protein